MLTKKEFVGWVDDDELLRKFSESCDVVTLENEFIDWEKLALIESFGIPVIPSSLVIKRIQDKLIQKQTLAKYGIPVPAFVSVQENSGYWEIVEILGKKFVLKTRTMGYDGYGNATVSGDEDYSAKKQKLLARNPLLMAEEFIRFDKELAVMVVRTKKQILAYPVVETIQKEHICKYVIAPAEIKVKTAKAAREIAVEAVKAVNGYGLFGVELFLSGDEVLLNEMAPRPHNSGHYTIEATITSQFENHIRCVVGLPLGDVRMITPTAVMMNLLGTKNGTGKIQPEEKVFSNPGTHIHLYGKSESRPGRKMGHITVTGNSAKTLYRKLKSLDKLLTI